MSTLYGVNADKLLVDDPSARPGVGEQGGKLQCIYDTYELTGDLDAADIIEMGGLIPEGARVHDAHLWFDDLDASGGTLDFGWKASTDADTTEAADPNGFLNAVDVTSAGAQSMLGDQPTTPGNFKKFSKPVQPIVTVSGDTDATSGTVTIAIWFAVD